jgi:hypothetical protein
MNNGTYRISVEAPDALLATQGARILSDDLREVEGVLNADRVKGDQPTMDLGAIVTVLASSGATLAIARGVADWIRRTPQTRLVIDRDPQSGSIKAVVEKIDPDAALKIIETVLKA